MKIAGGSEGLQGTEERDAAMRQEALVFPTSFAQRGLWFLDQIAPSSSTYNISQAFELGGRLQRTALERSLNEIARRHEILRTTFVEVEGEPAQLVAPPTDQPLRVVSLSQIPHGEREAEALRLIEQEAHRPFDLTQGPLFRATLFGIDAEEHILLMTMHHIVSDGWSMGVLYRELSVLYEAFCQHKVPSLPELPIQYADYAVWQRQWLQSEVLERQLSYWRQQLSAVPVLEVSTDRPRPAAQSYRGARQSLALPKALSDGLKALSRREGATLFMTLLSAFQVLLHRYTGQDDIVIGSPIAGRTRAEIEELIGLFINTLVLRGDLSGDPKFTELMARARKMALEAYEHQDLPFEKLVEELRPERDPSRSPLFQVMFVLQNMPRTALELAGVTVTPLEVDSGTAKFDLTLSMAEAAGALAATLEYNTDLFDHDAIERMVGHFRILLEGIVANPEQRLSELPLLTEAERRQLLVEWNDTKRDYPKDKCVHELFEEQVERTPDAVAVVFEDTQLTYRELNRRANQLAHYLQKLGVGPEALVGVCVERSLEMVVGLLGILKSGGAYVPLDPAYPKERLAFMVADSQAAVLLTQSKILSQLSEMIGDGRPPADTSVPQSTIRHPTVICLDTDWKTIAQESEHNPLAGVTGDNPAYLIYTSGSTGMPKGVLITHRGLVNHTLAAANHYGIHPNDRRTQFASLSFDVAAAELFPAWSSGAAVVLRPDPWFDSFEGFLEFLERERITVLSLPTAFWHEWVSHLSRSKPELPSALRLLVIGTEQASPDRLAAWRSFVGNRVRWCNAYGPTEASITTTIFDLVSCQEDGALVTVPIGRPIANAQVYLLDRHQKPVPVGVPGELYIGGAGLARGYLNRPDLTAEKFLPNPFSEEASARLYKTGDLAHYLADGNIECLGRIDHQVKIRGFRIELGEIETVLGQHSAVRQAIVLAREDTPGDKRLVAYVVPDVEQVPTVSELRNILNEKLLEYMVPSVFVFLDALPLTPNGKVDRRSLPAPDQSRPEQVNSFVPPSTPVEKTIADIWTQVLKVDKVGNHDNFFDLGGHSLLATQVISRMRHALQIELPLRAIFEAPTVAGLAVKITEARAKKVVPGGMADLLADLESISEEEARRLLAGKR